MRESSTYGAVRGGRGNVRPYRESCCLLQRMSPRAVVLMGHVRAPVPFDKPLSVLRRSWGRERSGEAPSTDIVRDQPRNTARASTSRRAATTIQISVYAGGRGAVRE